MVRLTVTVTFSFTSGPTNAYIITTVVEGILTFRSFTNGVYKMTYLSALVSHNYFSQLLCWRNTVSVCFSEYC